MSTLLEVKNLETTFHTEKGSVKVIEGLNFSIDRGQTLGLVGESGCGKSITSLSIIDLLPKPMGQVTGGEILFNGQDLRKISIEELYKIRGRKISFIFQEPMTALNPIHTIGQQLGEVYDVHFPEIGQSQKKEKLIEALSEVGIPDPASRLKAYPHQLSGGLRQRVVIAMAMALRPELLIADEPTTALDVTIQAQILGLLQKLQEKNKMSMLFISHDLGVMAHICHQLAVMYAGRIIEYGDVKKIFKQPTHPYTQGLLNSLPKFDLEPGSHLSTIEGQVPDVHHFPKGCRFANRCHLKKDHCERFNMDLAPFSEQHFVACPEVLKKD
jgi:oligopeptide/dipeptide ABC transporter ATP-binding protein